MGCALVSLFLLPDFPVNSKRFPERLRQVAIQRLVAEQVATKTEGSGMNHFFGAKRKSLSNWRTWILAVGYTVRISSRNSQEDMAYMFNRQLAAPAQCHTFIPP